MMEGLTLPGYGTSLMLDALVMRTSWELKNCPSPLRLFCDEYGMDDVEKAYYMIDAALVYMENGYYITEEKTPETIYGHVVKNIMYYLNHVSKETNAS